MRSESRFLTEETGLRALRRDIPIQTPLTSTAIEATALRNQLLAWRFQARFTVGPDPSRLVEGRGAASQPDGACAAFAH